MNKLVAGTKVVCTYRMPSVHQPWIHPVYIGVIQEPGDDPADWNGKNSERTYCEACEVLPVRYYTNFPYDLDDSFLQHDHIEDLVVVTDKQANLSHPEKVLEFLGEEAMRNYNQAMGADYLGYLAEHVKGFEGK